MGLFDDISYGLGISDSKPSGYDERTANSIEKNQGSAAADRYRDEKGIGSGVAMHRGRQLHTDGVGTL